MKRSIKYKIEDIGDTIIDICAPILIGVVVVLGALTIIIISMTLVGGLYKTDKTLERFNNGHCICGGTFEYTEISPHQTETGYIYTCDKCGDKVELYEYKIPEGRNEK